MARIRRKERIKESENSATNEFAFIRAIRVIRGPNPVFVIFLKNHKKTSKYHEYVLCLCYCEKAALIQYRRAQFVRFGATDFLLGVYVLGRLRDWA